MNKAISVISDDMKHKVKERLKQNFLKESEIIKDIIIKQYDDKLVDVVGDSESLLDPSFYRDTFILRLDGFKYTTEHEDAVTINIPDMDTFDFSGGLEAVETMLSGLVGDYVEVEDEDYISIFNAVPKSEDDIISFPEGVYLIRYSASIYRLENILNKSFNKYPFSNTPPIDIFEDATYYVDSNLDKWMDSAIRQAESDISTKYRGATI